MRCLHKGIVKKKKKKAVLINVIFAIDLGSLIMKSVLWSEKLKCYDVGQLYRAVCPVEGEAERLLGFICQLFGGMCVCVGG